MKRWSILIAALLFSVPVFAQQTPPTPEEREKQLLEYIDKEVQRLSNLLKLEYWQEFYVDSTLVHDFHAMQDEMTELQSRKVANMDMYTSVTDKWMEQIYQSYHRFFNEEQWARYLKNGAARDKKARDKRKARMEKNSH